MMKKSKKRITLAEFKKEAFNKKGVKKQYISDYVPAKCWEITEANLADFDNPNSPWFDNWKQYESDKEGWWEYTAINTKGCLGDICDE